MRRMKLALVVALLAMSPVAAANLFSNGSFEDLVGATVLSPPPGEGSFDSSTGVLGSGAWRVFSAIPGWTVGALGVEVRNNIAGTAFDGTNYAELDTTGNSWISQTVGTVLSAPYTVSFVYSPRIGQGAATNGIKLLVDGVQVLSITAPGTGLTDHLWIEQTYSFLGTGTPTVFRFEAFGTSDGLGGSLDKVALVPEPGTYAMLLAGLGLLGFIARRRLRG